MQRKEESMPHTQEKKTSQQKMFLKGNQILDLTDIDFKLAITYMFKELKEIMSQELKESMRTMSYQIENINKNIEIIKRNPAVENTITGIKNSLEGLASRFE